MVGIPLNEDLYLDGPLTPGRIAKHDPATLLRGLVAEEAIPFGYGVMDGTDKDLQALIISGATGKFKGVAAYNPYASGIDEDDPSYATNDPCDILSRGYIVVPTVSDVDKDDVVRVFHTGANKGKFTADASANNTMVITGAEWDGTFASGFATLKLNGSFAITADT